MMMTQKKWMLAALVVGLTGAAACGPDEAAVSKENNVLIGVDMSNTLPGLDMSNPLDMRTPPGDDMGTSVEDMSTPPQDMRMPTEDMAMPVDMAPTPCDRDGDCAAPQLCVVDSASGETTCQDPTGTQNTGAACSDGSECRSGLCFNGACANPCDVGMDCPNGFDCEATMIPLDGGGTAPLSICIEADQNCLSNASCTPPEICVIDRTGAATSLTCQDPAPGGTDLGGVCANDGDCLSGLCLNNLCARPCERPNDCSTDGSFICEPATVTTGSGGSTTLNVCKPKPATQCLADSQCSGSNRCVATKSATSVDFTCGAPNAGGGEGGSSCSADADCAQNLCLDGQCAGPCQGNGDCQGVDFSCELADVPLANNATDTAQVCLPPVVCQEKGQCKVSEECFVRRGNQSIDTICRAGNVGGGSLGQICTQDSNCASNLCFAGRFDKVCSNPCNDDQDCGVTGYSCQSVAVADSAGNPVNTSICAPKTPTPCSARTDCASGLTCAVVANVANNGLESVCIPSTGKLATGVACNMDKACNSQVCLNGSCAAPCTESNALQCGSKQVCTSNTVTKGGNSGTFNLCERLPDVPCDSTSDCTDGFRVCGEIRSNGAGGVQTFCSFPNTGGAQLGSSCTANSDCREGICLSTSGECSVACEQDSQCSVAESQLCATFSFGQSSTPLDLCVRGCSDNGACTNGNICTIGQDVPNNEVEQICSAVIGTQELGASCASGNDCREGLCLTTTVFDGVACTTDTDCPGTKTCECPIDNPSCNNSAKQCADVSNRCSRLCDTPDDCSGGVANNALTSCSTDVLVQRPNGSGNVTLSLCGQPSP